MALNNPYLDRIIFLWNGTSRPAKQIGFAVVFMALALVISRYSPNVIYFIFSACFALCGLVLFFMGLINGIIDLFNYFLHRKPKKVEDTQ